MAFGQYEHVHAWERGRIVKITTSTGIFVHSWYSPVVAQIPKFQGTVDHMSDGDLEEYDDIDFKRLKKALGHHAGKIGFQVFTPSVEGLQLHLMGRDALALVRLRLVEMDDSTWRPYLDLAPWIREALKSAGILLEDAEYHPDDYKPADKMSIWQLRDLDEDEVERLRHAG